MTDILSKVSKAEEVLWINDKLTAFDDCKNSLEVNPKGVDDATARLERFAPVIMHYFPETKEKNGIIESPLSEIEKMRQRLESDNGIKLPGKMFLKRDSDLAVSGSVKARGGIYEVLKHTEDLALEAGILDDTSDDYLKLTTNEARDYFAKHKIQVGSTGNLGLSIGIMSAALGYEAIVHMSADAKQWKKDLLRKRGATVCEYEGDYAEAVKCGRNESDADPTSYFVDDEKSKELFYGYAVAGRRLAKQFEEQGVLVDGEHPLYVYIPCGVGGAPGGITYGLKLLYGDNVNVYFVEPTQAPCMLVGLASGKLNDVCVQDYGLTGQTEADGLAVGRCSALVAKAMVNVLSGEMTVSDDKLIPWEKVLWDEEGIFIEPSSCAAFQGPLMLNVDNANATHVLWATGGSMMPQSERKI